MTISSNSKVDTISAGKQLLANRPTLAILHCEDHGNLARLLTCLCSEVPSLLAASLPRKVVIKPNLCDGAGRKGQGPIPGDPVWQSSSRYCFANYPSL